MSDISYFKQGDSLYPEQFEQLYKPPRGIYARGDMTRLKTMPRLSVVGTRDVSSYGIDVTMRLVSEVAREEVAIISGLALGVDGLAHRAALEVGGYTIAVLACGLDRTHPRNHSHLANQIIGAGGALISEYEADEGALKYRFIERNRLIAALGDALLITEAALKSGTMHTVRFALDMGKTVMVVPGNINSPSSVGTNNLLKEGALPVSTAQDILEVLGMQGSKRPSVPRAENENEAVLLHLIVSGCSDINDLQARSTLSPIVFNQTLTMLELTSKIRSLGGGQWGIK